MNSFCFCLATVMPMAAIVGIANRCAMIGEQPKGRETLDVEEEAALRRIVYTRGLITATKIEKDRPPYRVLVVPNEFEKTYQVKRIAVLKLLLDIVKGGRADDALSAAAFAVAMERSPIALIHVDRPRDRFDEDVAGLGSTERSRLVTWLVERVANAEKESKENRKTKASGGTL